MSSEAYMYPNSFVRITSSQVVPKRADKTRSSIQPRVRTMVSLPPPLGGWMPTLPWEVNQAV